MERVQFARHLRRRATQAEKSVWSYIRKELTGFKFRRQQCRVLRMACLSAERRILCPVA